MANETLTRTRLKTPNAAAIAGLLFSLLLMAAFARSLKAGEEFKVKI